MPQTPDALDTTFGQDQAIYDSSDTSDPDLWYAGGFYAERTTRASDPASVADLYVRSGGDAADDDTTDDGTTGDGTTGDASPPGGDRPVAYGSDVAAACTDDFEAAWFGRTPPREAGQILGLTPDTTAGSIYTGTGGGDVLRGSAAADVFYGGSGADTIVAGDGADLIYGNRESDAISGEGGNDTIFAGQNDGPGDSRGYQRAGTETIDGGAGDDLIYGNMGDDLVSGASGNDTLYGGQDDDVLSGGDGDDVMLGNLGNDAFHFSNSDEGHDTIYGWNTGDTVTLNGGVYVSAFSTPPGHQVQVTLSSGTVIDIVGVSPSDLAYSYIA